MGRHSLFPACLLTLLPAMSLSPSSATPIPSFCLMPASPHSPTLPFMCAHSLPTFHGLGLPHLCLLSPPVSLPRLFSHPSHLSLLFFFSLPLSTTLRLYVIFSHMHSRRMDRQDDRIQNSVLGSAHPHPPSHILVSAGTCAFLFSMLQDCTFLPPILPSFTLFETYTFPYSFARTHFSFSFAFLFLPFSCLASFLFFTHFCVAFHPSSSSSSLSLHVRLRDICLGVLHFFPFHEHCTCCEMRFLFPLQARQTHLFAWQKGQEKLLLTLFALSPLHFAIKQ